MGNVNAKYCKKSFTFVLLSYYSSIYYAKSIAPIAVSYPTTPLRTAHGCSVHCTTPCSAVRCSSFLHNDTCRIYSNAFSNNAFNSGLNKLHHVIQTLFAPHAEFPCDIVQTGHLVDFLGRFLSLP